MTHSKSPPQLLPWGGRTIIAPACISSTYAFQPPFFYPRLGLTLTCRHSQPHVLVDSSRREIVPSPPFQSAPHDFHLDCVMPSFENNKCVCYSMHTRTYKTNCHIVESLITSGRAGSNYSVHYLQQYLRIFLNTGVNVYHIYFVRCVPCSSTLTAK